jgi:nitrate/nitrite transporter NarK
MGLKAPLISLISAAFVRFIGEVYDRTGDYDIAFYSFAAVLIVAILLILSTRTRRDVGPPVGEVAVSV